MRATAHTETPVRSARALRWRPRKLLLQLMAAAAFLIILAPLFFVVWLSLYSQEIPSYPPDGYTLEWYGEAWRNDRFLDAFVTSAQVGVLATLIGLALALPAAFGLSRLKFFGSGAINNLLLMPLIVPGIVLGFAIYGFLVEIAIATQLNVFGTFAGLVFGHVLLVIPWMVRLILASLTGFDRTLEEAAQSLGADRFTTFRRVTMPAILPGIVAGALFGFVASFGNLEMSLFLVGPGRTTLPIAILQYLEWKIDPTIAAISVLQILVITAALLATDRIVRLSRVV